MISNRYVTETDLNEVTQCYIQWDSSQSDPTIGFTGLNKLSDTTSRLKWVQKYCRHCVFKNGAVNYYLDESNLNKKVDGSAAVLTGADGDVMLEIDTLYWKVTVDNGVFGITVSPYNPDGTWATAHRYGDQILKHIYIGVFEGVLVDNKLRSINTSSAPRTSATQPQFCTWAAANGARYYIESYTARTLWQILTTFVIGTRNSQAVVGNGNVKASAAIAVNDNWSATEPWIKGSSDSNVGVTCLGIHNPWGNVWELMANTIFNNGNLYFSVRNNDNYNISSGSGSRPSTWRSVATGCGTYASQSYIQDVCKDAYATFFPSSYSGGSASTYYCDGVWSNPGDRYCQAGGAWQYGALCGTFCTAVNSPNGTSDPRIGARLQAYGTEVIS